MGLGALRLVVHAHIQDKLPFDVVKLARPGEAPFCHEAVEVEADSEWEALSIAEGYAVDINDAWDHAGHTSTQALQADLIEGEA